MCHRVTSPFYLPSRYGATYCCAFVLAQSVKLLVTLYIYWPLAVDRIYTICLSTVGFYAILVGYEQVTQTTNQSLCEPVSQSFNQSKTNQPGNHLSKHSIYWSVGQKESEQWNAGDELLVITDIIE